jgi:hypothetical protein
MRAIAALSPAANAVLPAEKPEQAAEDGAAANEGAPAAGPTVEARGNLVPPSGWHEHAR